MKHLPLPPTARRRSNPQERLLFRDPQTGRSFPWEFNRGGEVMEVNVTGRILMDDPSVAVAACAAGQRVFQSLAGIIAEKA